MGTASSSGEAGTGPGDPPVRYTGVAVIGGGLAGLAAAVRLLREGRRDVLVLERASELGGTWRDNTYPGAACDVPSHLYSFSFAPNPGWSRSFSPQAEIQDYVLAVARRYRVRRNVLLDCDVRGARWDADDRNWVLDTTRGRIVAPVLVCAFGPLAEPSVPDLPGVEDFEGTIMHSARWDHDVDLDGKRVAVVGTGASAVQIVPAIADRVASLEIHQRTPPWILPRADRAYSRLERALFRYLPFTQRLARTAIYWARESQAVGLSRHPELLAPLQAAARGLLRAQVTDPALRRTLTPDYRIGCKRMLISNDYYPTLNRDHVRVVPGGVRGFKANAVVSAGGEVHETDVVIMATGFHVTDSPMYERIVGRDGRALADMFDEHGHQCYKGTTVAGFPNMFYLIGPGTGLGHSSMIFMIESQLNYLSDALATMRRRRIRSVEVRRHRQERFGAELDERLSRSVWDRGGCSAWYRDRHGRASTLWPGHTFEFRSITRRFDVDAYRVDG